MMRSKKALINTVMSLTEEIVSVICGFILPRLILSVFGSKYNGLITSITQFLTCAVLLRSGIGGATRAALYKPLAMQDHGRINSIIKATDGFMKKVGLILAASITVFAAVYPFLVRNEFEWFFTFSLFIIIGVTTFANSFFGITYLIVLQADQKLWVSALVKTICYICNVCLAVVLILNGASIHLVKLGSSCVFLAYPFFLSRYVKRKYHIDKNAEPDHQAIAQRWDAFWQQVAVFVMNNTDVMVLTVFSNMLEVSVYSVYNMIVNGLKRVIFAFSNGLEAAFGNMLAKKEEKALRENVAIIEVLMFGISTIVYVTAILLVNGFIGLYTKGVYDVNYIRPEFALLFFVAQFFNVVRIPYQLVVQAAGHYKQTKKGAIIEPIINLGLSCALVVKLGLIGIAIGTLAATIFRTVQYSYYMSRNIVKRNQLITVFRTILALMEGILIYYIVKRLGFMAATSFFVWFLNALITGAIAAFVVAFFSILIYRKDTIACINKLRNALGRR